MGGQRRASGSTFCFFLSLRAPRLETSRYKTGTMKSYRANKAMSKLILVLGATGAQGRSVVKSLLAPSEDGTPSPYAVRALSRDPESKQALSLREQGVEVFRGRSSGISARRSEAQTSAYRRHKQSSIRGCSARWRVWRLDQRRRFYRRRATRNLRWFAHL
jgi:hypothetical protein